MTDNEIIKAMQQCNGWNGRCLNCHLNSEGTDCKEKLNSYALYLIDRQRARIEKLKKENKILSINADTAFQDGLNEAQDLYAEQVRQEIKSEAIKEFAERLKEKYCNEFEFNPRTNKRYIPTKKLKTSCDWILHEVVPSSIDNLVKEMTK